MLLAVPAAAEISREDLRKALEANPDLVLSALKKADKMKFFTLVVESQQEYQRGKAKEEARLEAEERDKAFKNPLKPEIGAGARTRGNANAPVTIVEYSDFQCPYCTQGYKNLEELRRIHGDKLRVVFKNFPLNFHPMAMPAAQWFEALYLQSPDKAWSFHDALFENQSKLSEDYFKLLTKDLGLDVAKAAKDAKSDKKTGDKVASRPAPKSVREASPGSRETAFSSAARDRLAYPGRKIRVAVEEQCPRASP